MRISGFSIRPLWNWAPPSAYQTVRPGCEECPAAEFCLGRARGTAQTLPVKAPKKARRVEEKTVFLLLRQGKIALRRRPEDGLLAGLWEFPNVDGILDEKGAPAAVQAWGLAPGRGNASLRQSTFLLMWSGR